MSGSVSRTDAIKAVVARPQLQNTVSFEAGPEAIFAQNVFTQAEMQKRLPKAVFKKLIATIEKGEKMDPAIADTVAAAMKDWAMAKGATHYAHVFFPLTGISAEKHDSFIEPDGKGGIVTEFSGKSLVQGEPDGSSFPSGGIRATFEARGYTVWDVTSPAYILENANGRTLCIPTAFISWTGEALDKKTPVLRSIEAAAKQAARVVSALGQEPGYIGSSAGPEQEYFLIDRNFYFARPDLQLAGRTLFGAPPAKGQEFEDQYFGAIPERVLACMHDIDNELYKLGVPVKTRHNEVAPSQYEIAPVYESANVAADHQQLIMTTLKKVAEKYGLACILHEKPFAGVNGSGKHLNWSLGGAKVGNLLEPGDTPHENVRFLLVAAAVIRAVHLNAKLLRHAVAHAANDHRLGANEAPPAIISIFLGDMLSDVFESVAKGKAKGPKARVAMDVGVNTLPPFPKDYGDRNRTSPFAFTGNKFEFRAVGSSQSINGPLMVLNTIVAESLDYVATRLEKEAKGDAKKAQEVAIKLIGELWNAHKAVVFNGNGYSEAWHKEAEKRGLPNLRNTADALPVFGEKASVALFTKYGVLSEREVHARAEIYAERYCKDIAVEAKLTAQIATKQILPAAIKYAGQLASDYNALKAAGQEACDCLLKEVNTGANALGKAICDLEKVLEKHPAGDVFAHAHYWRNEVLPAMGAVRKAADELETVVADSFWPLPTYQEMLFIK